MCFLTCLCGNQSRLSSQNVQYVGTKKIHRSDLIENYYEAVPIHKRQDLIDETIKLINDEWPRTRCSRLWSLGSSRDQLPTSLIVTFKSNGKTQTDKNQEISQDDKHTIPTETKIINDMFFNQQNINIPKISNSGEPIQVLAHLRLLPVPSDEKSCFIESMVVNKEYRGKGIGSFLIKEAQKYCEQVLHLKHIYLNTIDSGEFYMKLGFELTEGIAIFGQGETNSVSKKIFLKKSLNYVECEEQPENEEIYSYDPKKDLNYLEQQKIENDVILNGFAAKPDSDKMIAESLSVLFDTPLEEFKYYYSFEHFNRTKEERSFHFAISFKTNKAKTNFIENGRRFGVLCYQNIFEIFGKVVNEAENTLITIDYRLTKLNLIIRKELISLLEENVISSWEFADNLFYAIQDDCKINVYNLGILELIKMQNEPDEEPESIGWETNSDELEKDIKALEKFKDSLRRQSTQYSGHYKWLSNQNNESFDSGVIVEEENESANDVEESIDEKRSKTPLKTVKKVDKEKGKLILQHCTVENRKTIEKQVNEWLCESDFESAKINDESSSLNTISAELKPKRSLDSLMDFLSMGFGCHP